MKKFLLAAAAAFLTANLGLAADKPCADKAAEKKLSGAARASFISKCEKDACEAQATEKKLAGAAKASFVKKCGSEVALSNCESAAAEKHLAGAARSSFMKKCEADAKAGK